jgi:hypothetical protein
VAANGKQPQRGEYDASASCPGEHDACAGKNAGNPTCDGAIAAGWTKVVSSASDAFPSVNPRPVAPDLSLRSFDSSSNEVATHVKFVVTSNQCTGQASYHGDQDNDPTNNADCNASIGRTRCTSRRCKCSRRPPPWKPDRSIYTD